MERRQEGWMSSVRKITAEELHAEMKAQGVEDRQDIAFKCVMCATVQSMRSMLDAGVDPARVENVIGFSCEGRWRNAGPAKRGEPERDVRGCDWTLGGLFTLHRLEVTTPDGKTHPSFELASPAEAQALAKAFQESEVA
jgi:hypothetical protein